MAGERESSEKDWVIGVKVSPLLSHFDGFWPTSGPERASEAQTLPCLKVSHDCTLPLCRPVLNHRWRCALVPWVKLSGTT